MYHFKDPIIYSKENNHKTNTNYTIFTKYISPYHQHNTYQQQIIMESHVYQNSNKEKPKTNQTLKLENKSIKLTQYIVLLQFSPHPQLIDTVAKK